MLDLLAMLAGAVLLLFFIGGVFALWWHGHVWYQLGMGWHDHYQELRAKWEAQPGLPELPDPIDAREKFLERARKPGSGELP